MFAFPLFLLSTAVEGAQSTTYEIIAYVIGVPSLALHFVAAFGYIPLALAALKEERERCLICLPLLMGEICSGSFSIFEFKTSFT